MKLFTSGRYAAVASTAALVVALGGTSYAAAQITSNNIKDGTIQTKDISLGARTQVHQVHNDSGTAVTSSDKTVLSIHLKAGTFALSSKVQAFYSATSPYVNCSLVGPGGVLDTGYWYVPGGGGYGQVVNQAIFTTNSATNVQLNCNGFNAGVYNKKLTAVRVAQGTDSLGANVAKTALPKNLR